MERRLRKLKKARKQDIDEEVERMKRNPGGKGVDRGYTYDERGQINGRWAVSNNPEWYQRAYKKYGRKPKKSEYEDIAEDTLGEIQKFGERDNEIARLERLRREMKENEDREKSAQNKKAANEGGRLALYDKETVKKFADSLTYDDVPMKQIPHDLIEKINKASNKENLQRAVDYLDGMKGEIFKDPMGTSLYFEPGNTETMEEYALHLVAGKDAAKSHDLSKIRDTRVLGVLLAQNTVEDPLAVVVQAGNQRRVYVSVYKGDVNYANSLIIGVEKGQDGRVVTVFMSGSKRDKKAALRELKNRLSGENTQKVLYISDGLYGHSQPTTEHRTSLGSASLRPSGDSSIPQGNNNGNKKETPNANGEGNGSTAATATTPMRSRRDGEDVSNVTPNVAQEQEKSNKNIGSFTIGKDGKRFAASLGRSLDSEGMENLSTLAESFGGTEKEGQFSFRTAKDRSGFLELANAYIGLLDEVNNGRASASADKTKIRGIVRAMRFVPTTSMDKQGIMLSTMGETMGCPIVWVDASPQLNGIHFGNVTFLNRRAGMDLKKTFWHEQFHWIKANNQALYRELLSYFKGNKAFTKQQLDKYREDIGRYSLSDDETIEEMLADDFMEVSRRVPMLQEMAGEKPSLARRFIAWVKRMMDRVSEWFHNPDGKLTTAQRDAFVRAFGKLADSMKDSKGRPLFKTHNNGRRITLANGDSLLSQLLDAVKNPLQDIAGIKLSAAWHGSPYKFYTFSLIAIGTGEGAQVHGWGLYFAKERGVSEYYREKLSDGRATGRLVIGGKEYGSSLFSMGIV